MSFPRKRESKVAPEPHSGPRLRGGDNRGTRFAGFRYNWTAHQWTVPVEGGVSQVLKIGSQPISIAAMAKYWAVRPDGTPVWGARFVLTFLFPK